MTMPLTIIFNLLLIIAFIVDRIFRLKSINEYKEAQGAIVKLKDVQIDALKNQLELERKNSDLELAEIHKRRYENLKMVFAEQVAEIDKNQVLLIDLKKSLDNAQQEIGLSEELSAKLLAELNRVQRYKHTLEIERKLLLSKIGNPGTSVPE